AVLAPPKPPRGAQDRGGAPDAALPPPKATADPPGGPRRRVGVDGPVCPTAAPVPLCAPERVLPGGDVRLRHAAEPGDRRAPGAGIPGRPREPLGPRAGLERRHAHRRVALGLPLRLATPRRSPDGGGGAQRWVGDGRSGRAGRLACGPAPPGGSPGVAEPAPREPRLRAADPGDAGGAPPSRRVRAGERPRQPRAAGAAPEPLSPSRSGEIGKGTC